MRGALEDTFESSIGILCARMAKLLTNHDPGHVHAGCGLVALLHYIYRLWLIICDIPDAGFGRSVRQDILCMTIMALPNITSFLFTTNIVPAKKGKDGFTIWKEYRLHAFIFAFKLWLLIAILLYQKHSNQHADIIWPNEQYFRIALEIATMAAAYYATSLYPPQVSTIRGMYSHSLTVFVAGFLQFMGRASIFYGAPDPKDDVALPFMAILIIQLNAFNMTLRKKRIIGPRATQAFYSIMLGSGLHLMLIRRILEHGTFPPRGLPVVVSASIAYACRKQGLDRFSAWAIALTAVSVLLQ